MPDVLSRHSEVVLWNLLSVEIFYWWICRGKSGLPSYSSTIIGESLPLDLIVCIGVDWEPSYWHLSLFPLGPVRFPRRVFLTLMQRVKYWEERGQEGQEAPFRICMAPQSLFGGMIPTPSHVLLFTDPKSSDFHCGEGGASALSLSPTSRSAWWCQYVSFSGILLYTVSPQHINIQVLNFQRCELVFQQSQEGVTLKLALQLLLLMILQFHHLPPPLPPPVSNSSCLFTWHKPLDASCCSSLLYFSKYYTVRLKIYERDIPGGSSSKEYTCPCRGHRFDPWSRSNQCATTAEPKTTEPKLRAYAPRQRGAPTSCNSRKSEQSNEDPVQPKINEEIFFFLMYENPSKKMAQMVKNLRSIQNTGVQSLG